MPKTTIVQKAKPQLQRNKQTYQDSGNPNDIVLAKPILQVHVFENSPHGKPFQHCVMMQLKYEDLASFLLIC